VAAARKAKGIISSIGQSGEVEVIDVPNLNIKRLTLSIWGTTPLLVNKWCAKAEDDDQRFLTQAGKDAVPVSWFKLAFVGAARYMQGITRTLAQMSVIVLGDEDGLVPLKFKKCETLSVVSRNDYSRKCSEVMRPVYYDWGVDLPIEYVDLTDYELVALVNEAGARVGIGTGRPEVAATKGKLMRRKRTYNSIQLNDLPTVGTFAVDWQKRRSAA
jgi:hypothetical protein